MSVYFPFEGKNNCEHKSLAIFYYKLKYNCDFLLLMICNIKSDNDGLWEVTLVLPKEMEPMNYHRRATQE